MSDTATAPAATTDRGGARLLVMISIVVFVDTMLYAVLAPLLPGLVHELRLSKLSAGVMSAGYPLGMLVGSLPGGLLVVRVGPRFTVCAGLLLLTGSIVAFGCLDNVAALDASRFVEGLGGACSWAGGLAWIVVDTPADRRGALIGRALGAGIGGALLGPVVGSIATATGRAPAFIAIGAGAALLLLWASQRPSSHRTSGQGVGRAWTVIASRPGAAGMWLMALPAVASGLVNVLGPLRLHHLGVAAAGVGATYLVAAGLEASLSPAIGRLSDRHGRMAPLRSGLGLATVLILCFTLPGDGIGLGAVIALISCALALFWAPAMAMLSDVAESAGLDQGLAAGLMNLAWAGGQVLGAGVGGALAKATGDGVPMDGLAALCALTLLAVTVLRARQRA
jgi:MFS family permease